MADMKPWHGLPRLPDTHCFDDDTQSDCWSYSPELVRKMLEQERREERESCAALCESFKGYPTDKVIADELSNAIRARGEA